MEAALYFNKTTDEMHINCKINASIKYHFVPQRIFLQKHLDVI